MDPNKPLIEGILASLDVEKPKVTGLAALELLKAFDAKFDPVHASLRESCEDAARMRLDQTTKGLKVSHEHLMKMKTDIRDQIEKSDKESSELLQLSLDETIKVLEYGKKRAKNMGVVARTCEFLYDEIDAEIHATSS